MCRAPTFAVAADTQKKGAPRPRGKDDAALEIRPRRIVVNPAEPTNLPCFLTQPRAPPAEPTHLAVWSIFDDVEAPAQTAAAPSPKEAPYMGLAPCASPCGPVFVAEPARAAVAAPTIEVTKISPPTHEKKAIASNKKAASASTASCAKGKKQGGKRAAQGGRSRLLADSKQRSVLLRLILCAGMYAVTTLAFVPGSPFYIGQYLKQAASASSSLSRGAPFAKNDPQTTGAPLHRLSAVTVPADREHTNFDNGTVFSSPLARSESGDDGLIVEIPGVNLPIQTFDLSSLDYGVVGEAQPMPSSFEGEEHLKHLTEGQLTLPTDLDYSQILGMSMVDLELVDDDDDDDDDFNDDDYDGDDYFGGGDGSYSDGLGGGGGYNDGLGIRASAASVAESTLSDFVRGNSKSSPSPSSRGVRHLMNKAMKNVDTPKWDLSKKKMDEVTALPSNPQGAEEKEEEEGAAATEKRMDVKREILTMTLPLLAVWLSSPILSIVDTIVVGRTAGIHELAALGPATAVCDTGAYFFNFLCIVTTAKVANAVVRKDPEAEKRGVGDGILAATVMGSLYSAMLLSPLGAKFLGAFTSAGGAATAQCFGVALDYVRIRAVGMVFGLCTAVYQSACLARHNTVLPLVSVVAAGLFNLVFDCVLVLGMGKGAAGAAWASVAAQAAAFLVLARNERQVSLRITELAANQAKNAKTVGRAVGRSLGERARSCAGFLKECVSPASALAGKAAVVMMHTASVSGCGSSVALAAHQCLYAVLQLFTPFGEALSQTVQSLLPRVNQESIQAGSRRLTPQAGKLVKALLFAAAGLGTVNAVVAGSIPLFMSHIFTSDAAVAAQMATVAPLVMAILLFHAISTTLEGVLFTSGDSKFLGRFYPVNCAVVASIFLFARSQHAPLMTLWSIMFSYNFARVLMFGARTVLNQRVVAEAKSSENGEGATPAPALEEAADAERERADLAFAEHSTNIGALESLLDGAQRAAAASPFQSGLDDTSMTPASA